RHAVVQRCNEFIGPRRENRKRANPLVSLGVVPIFPQPGESERVAIAQSDGVRLLRYTGYFPLIERVRWHEAAARLICAAKRRGGFDRLAARVDALPRDLRVLGPIRD